MTRYAALAATGCYLPEGEVTNDELKRRLPESVELLDKMASATGIRRRWHAPDDWATSDLALPAARQALERAGKSPEDVDLALPAARQALERAGKSPEDVDLIVLGTDSPDYITPATSVVLQHKLGARNAGTFDVGCACASFPTGLAAAAGLMAANGGLETVLVVGAYLMHRLADPKDPMTFFYGDGAGAAVLVPSEAPGVLGATFQADGAYHGHWGIYAGGTAEPASEEAVKAGRTRVVMRERYPPEINHDGWPRLVRRLAAQVGFTLGEIDLILFTQVRKPSIELVMRELGLPMARTHTVMEEWGYTGSACIPMALHDAREKGMARKGQLVVLVGSGVGYNQAAVALRA